MAIGDTLSQLGVNIGEGGIVDFSFIADLIIFLIVAALCGGLAYWYAMNKSWNKTIVKYREINGRTVRVGVEKAKEVELPNTSVRALFLKNSKVYLPRPSIESGKEEYLYFIRNDGEWLNVGLDNVNEKMAKIGLKYDHTDMRMANAALKKLVDRSYKKTNWLKEWAPYIGFASIILMLGIAGYLVMDKAAEVNSSAAATVDVLGDITESMKSILISIDNIQSSSGARSAGG